MARPRKGYWLDGKRLPSVTTITNRFKDSGGLIHWAWTEGYEGRDYRDTRDKAANAGTLTHKVIENLTRYGIEPVIDGNAIFYVSTDDDGTEHVTETLVESADDELIKRVRNAFGAFREWSAGSRFKVAKSELSLISEKYKFGGMMDAVVVHDRRGLGDWKTAAGVYPDNLYQLGGYAVLYEENFPDEPLEGFHLLRFDRDFGDFHHHFWTDLDEAKKGFLMMRELYDLDKRIKKRAG